MIKNRLSTADFESAHSAADGELNRLKKEIIATAAVEEQHMTMRDSVRAAAPWVAMAAVSALTVTIVVMAPEMGGTVALALTGAWTVLAIVRIILIVRVTRKLYQNFGRAIAAR